MLEEQPLPLRGRQALIIMKQLALLAVALAATFNFAAAQEYPSRAITILVPFTAGGPNDLAARVYADGLRRQFGGATIVIENRPGGAGIPGTEAALQGDHEGYTLLMGGIAPLVLIPPVQKVRYDTEKDFAPLGLMWRSPQAFAVHPKLGVKTVAEFVARAKAGKLTIGSAGLGTVTHLANELLRREAGIDFAHVPYKSTANSLNDLLGGHIDAIFGDVALVKPQAEAGKLVALAVTGAARSPLMPELVTIGEAGVPKVQTEVWYGALVSARAPARDRQAPAGRDARGADRPCDAEDTCPARHRAGRAGRGRVRAIHARGTCALAADRDVGADEIALLRPRTTAPVFAPSPLAGEGSTDMSANSNG